MSAFKQRNTHNYIFYICLLAIKIASLLKRKFASKPVNSKRICLL